MKFTSLFVSNSFFFFLLKANTFSSSKYANKSNSSAHLAAFSILYCTKNSMAHRHSYAQYSTNNESTSNTVVDDIEDDNDGNIPRTSILLLKLRESLRICLLIDRRVNGPYTHKLYLLTYQPILSLNCISS